MTAAKWPNDTSHGGSPACPSCGRPMALQSLTASPFGAPFAHFGCECGYSSTVPWFPWPPVRQQPEPG